MANRRDRDEGLEIVFMYKKLSCRRETARCFVSLNILLSHLRSLKVIRNDTFEKRVSPY